MVGFLLYRRVFVGKQRVSGFTFHNFTFNLDRPFSFFPAMMATLASPFRFQNYSLVSFRAWSVIQIELK